MLATMYELFHSALLSGSQIYILLKTEQRHRHKCLHNRMMSFPYFNCGSSLYLSLIFLEYFLMKINNGKSAGGQIFPPHSSSIWQHFPMKINGDGYEILPIDSLPCLTFPSAQCYYNFPDIVSAIYIYTIPYTSLPNSCTANCVLCLSLSSPWCGKNLPCWVHAGPFLHP